MSGGPKVTGPNGKEIKLEHAPKDYKNVTLGTGNKDSGHVVGSFEGKGKKDAHVKKHAKEMGLTEKLYVLAASDFLSKPLSESMEEIVVTGPSGYSSISRYDFSTNEFGVINPRGNISTYYKPKKGASEWEKLIKLEGVKNE